MNVVPRDFLGMPTQLTSIRIYWLPLPLRDAIGRLVSWLAFGKLARYGLARPQLGPLSSIELRGRVPVIDVDTIAAIKRGAIAVKPAVGRLTETGAAFADGSAADFDAAIFATGYRPPWPNRGRSRGVVGDDGCPRDWKAGGAPPGLFFVGYRQPATGLLREIAIEAEAAAAAIAANQPR